jgi:hypothetical protein
MMLSQFHKNAILTSNFSKIQIIIIIIIIIENFKKIPPPKKKYVYGNFSSKFSLQHSQTILVSYCTASTHK